MYERIITHNDMDGVVSAASKSEMLKKKQEVLQGIYKLWISQGERGRTSGPT